MTNANARQQLKEMFNKGDHIFEQKMTHNIIEIEQRRDFHIFLFNHCQSYKLYLQILMNFV